MEDLERLEEDLEGQDREMLRHMHLQFDDRPGNPRNWEELSDRNKELIRDLYRKGTQGVIDGG